MEKQITEIALEKYPIIMDDPFDDSVEKIDINLKKRNAFIEGYQLSLESNKNKRYWCRQSAESQDPFNFPCHPQCNNCKKEEFNHSLNKQITTVYVPTDEELEICYFNGCEWIPSEIKTTQAYLYTPEEHAAVQGYREALEKILKVSTNSFIHDISTAALSKAEDKGDEIKKEDELFNIELEFGIPSNLRLHNYKSTTQPTNSLDELERWVGEDGSDFLTIDDIRRKIKSLKIINY